MNGLIVHAVCVSTWVLDLGVFFHRFHIYSTSHAEKNRCESGNLLQIHELRSFKIHAAVIQLFKFV